MARGARDDMWTCPECGHRFANRNQWHSCVNVPVDQHFEGCEPGVRELYEAFLEELRRHGPFALTSVKTRIGVIARMTFAELTPRKRWLRGHLILPHPVEGPPFTKVESFGPRSQRCVFVLREPADLDARFRALLAEAYARGEQQL